ncbi:Tim44 domain-containing protein [Rhodobacteraceae bacterium NNCM2]|nr:Tim44 domain-containing protein [Coraliihabitans acroporae]
MSSDMFELLILVAIAGGVLFYLRSVIGTRTGHEGPPARPFGNRQSDNAESDNVTPLNQPLPIEESEVVRNLDAPSQTALEGMRTAEEDFDLDGFLEGARSAYEMILMAYEEGDRETLNSLLAPDVLAAFEGVIAQREEQGLRVESRFIGVRDIRPVRLEFDPELKEADVTLRFVGEMITAVYDAENRVVEGDPTEIKRQTDVWTFSRVMGSPNPNWLLTATGE